GLGGNDADLAHRLDLLRRDRSQRAQDAKRTAQRWAEAAHKSSTRTASSFETSVGATLALAYPDRVAKNRGNGSFVLANGRGATMDAASALAREPFIVVAEMSGTAGQSRILLAAAILIDEIE